MSGRDLARRTLVETAFNGVDITGSIGPYLLSAVYTDNETDEADDLQLKLQDRDSLWSEQWLHDMVDAAASAAASPAAEKETGQYRVTPKIGLNVRDGPGTGCKKLGALPCGTVVKASGMENGWAVIQYRGRTAYVCAAYLLPVAGSGASASGAGRVYTVVRGDTLSAIAARYGTSWRVLAELNGITDPNLILPGQKISIPDGGSGQTQAAQARGMTIQSVIVQKNWAGDGKDRLLDCGLFELDAVKASGPPSVVTIKGTSLPFTAQVRQTKRSKAWKNRRLSEIAREIAGANGMVCMYESASDPFYAHLEQVKTSDIQFLETLCRRAGISLKAASRILVLFDQAAYESRAAVFTIKRGSGAYIKYDLNVGTADTQYSSCRVSYVDGTGKCIDGIATAEDYRADAKNDQQLEITAKVANTAEAKALAEKMLRLHNKYARTASFTLPGDTGLAAGVTVMLEEWGVWDGKYIVTQAKHTVGSSGYTVQIKLRRVLEGY